MPAKKPAGWSLKATPEQIMEHLGIGQKAQRRALRRAAEELRSSWIRTLSTKGEGRVYEAGLRFFTKGGRVIPSRDRSGVKRRNKVKVTLEDGTVVRGRHRASKPGDAPARDSGAGGSSIAVDDTRPDALRVGTNLLRLVYLEKGVEDHPGGITIAPRPHRQRAFDGGREKMIDVFRKSIRA